VNNLNIYILGHLLDIASRPVLVVVHSYHFERQFCTVNILRGQLVIRATIESAHFIERPAMGKDEDTIFESLLEKKAIGRCLEFVGLGSTIEQIKVAIGQLQRHLLVLVRGFASLLEIECLSTLIHRMCTSDGFDPVLLMDFYLHLVLKFG
jgi:hypothetical protein